MAVASAQGILEVGQSREQQGFSVMVDEIEFGEETTRVYVTVRNRTKNKVSFFTHNARIVQGSTQVDPEPPSPSYDFPKIQSDLNPGSRQKV